ncbi:MAG: nucleotide exchange factor GrpE [Terriglobia bacterium]
MMNEENPTRNLVNETTRAAESSQEDSYKKLQAERDVLYNQLVRRQADFENYKKRAEREQQEFRQQAEADLVLMLLPVLDAFERALNTLSEDTHAEEYRKGVELIYKQLVDILSRRGLKPVRALGEAFDPYLHHALERIESTDFRDQEVIAEFQPGYTFRERLLRPALVKVAVRPTAKQENST